MKIVKLFVVAGVLALLPIVVFISSQAGLMPFADIQNSTAVMALLSYAGTCFLGIMAIWHNMNLMEIESSRHYSNVTFYSMYHKSELGKNSLEERYIKVEEKDENDSQTEKKTFRFYMKNHGDALMREFSLQFGKRKEKVIFPRPLAKNEVGLYKVIVPSYMTFVADKKFNRRISESVDVEFTSCYGKKTYASFVIRELKCKSENDEEYKIEDFNLHGTSKPKAGNATGVA